MTDCQCPSVVKYEVGKGRNRVRRCGVMRIGMPCGEMALSIVSFEAVMLSVFHSSINGGVVLKRQSRIRVCLFVDRHAGAPNNLCTAVSKLWLRGRTNIVFVELSGDGTARKFHGAVMRLRTIYPLHDSRC